MREGGQTQFIAPEWPAGGDGLQDLMDWLQANLRKPLTLDAMARRASTSVRTLTRRFHAQTGTSPQRYRQTFLRTAIRSMKPPPPFAPTGPDR